MKLNSKQITILIIGAIILIAMWLNAWLIGLGFIALIVLGVVYGIATLKGLV